MLSAFRAQSIYELKPRDKSKIESILANGDRLFVGLSTGVLRIYQVNEQTGSTNPGEDGDAPKEQPTVKAVELLREEERFSKKPVQQLAMIKEAKLLISLSDGYIALHDLQTYQPVERLERTRGATCFATISNVVKDPELEVPSLVSRLAVGVKRRVICWTWQDMEVLPDVMEINMEANVKTINWVKGTRMVVGMDPGFSVVDISTEEVSPITKLGPKSGGDGSASELGTVRFGAVSSSGMGYMGMGSWVPKPMATGLSGDMILLAKDVNTLFTDTEGKALDKRQVPWAQTPEAIGYSYPYLLALQTPDKGVLQIRNPDTLSLLQTISIPGANLLHVPQPNISLAHAGKGFLVASDRTIWRMNALPYENQFTELVDAQRFDEAISLLDLLEDTLINDKAGRIREMKTQKAVLLFQQQKFQQARDLFIDAEASPDRVISLYPSRIAGALSSIPDEPSEESSEPEDSNTDDATRDLHGSATKGILGRMRGTQKRIDADAASIKSSVIAVDSDNASIRTKAGANVPERPGRPDNLKTATFGLCSFLADARRKIQRFLSPDGTLKENPPKFDDETGRPLFSNLLTQSATLEDANTVDWEAELFKTAQIVDTTLFRAYMFAQPSLAGPLFRLENFCEPEVVQAALYEEQRYGDLVDFLHGKKLHRKALEMLAKFGKGETDGSVPEGMQGPGRTILYLQQLPPDLIEMILEFASWPMQTDPQAAMNVFLADSDNAERLPRRQVLDFLTKIDERLAISYLEHIIKELGDEERECHQQLVDLYLIQLKGSDIDEHERSNLKSKLETFLHTSTFYDVGRTFRQLPLDSPIFFESRAIVLSAMGNHKQALSIYVYQLQDFTKAEDYCNRLYIDAQTELQAQSAKSSLTTPEKNPFLRQLEPEDTPEHPNLFAILLGLYLQPPPSESKNWPRALDLLSKHGPRLPASSTLDLMPDDLAVQDLHAYFRGRMRNATSLLREERLVKGLEGLRRDRLERTLLLGPDSSPASLNGVPHTPEVPQGRNRRVRIAEDDHCPVCHRRFKDNSAVRVLPSGVVIHYACITGIKSPPGTALQGNKAASPLRRGLAGESLGRAGSFAPESHTGRS